MLPVATEAADANANRLLHTPLSLRQHAFQMLRACRTLPLLGAVVKVMEQLLGCKAMDYVRGHRACLRIASATSPLLLAIADRKIR